jgi:hypothetical protein
MQQAWDRRERHIKFLSRNPEGKRPLLRRPMNRREDNIRMDLGKQGAKLWTGFIWLKI